MQEPRAVQTARSEMRLRNNCCQAVLLAAGEEWGVPVDDDLLAAASLFGRGMASGCSCGALVGIVMAAGLLEKDHPHPLGAELPKALHDRFKAEFGATCCRAIRKRHTFLDRLGNRACIDLTGRAARLLIEVWEGTSEGGPVDDLSDCPHVERSKADWDTVGKSDGDPGHGNHRE